MAQVKTKSRELKIPAIGAPLKFIWRPFQAFARLEAFSGILLLACAMVALSWANSRWGAEYHHFKEFPLGLSLGGIPMIVPLEKLVNDGLMALFFLLVGLEIKREMLAGGLASARKALFPAVAALGGMLVPAAIYLLINQGGPAADGWGIPMATDIAFALGVLQLLGKRVPLSLKVFLVALAILDDIGAILVIALFYTSQLSYPSLFLAGAFLAGLVFLNRTGNRHSLLYLLGGLFLWIALFHSGVHATLAGVALAFCIPTKTRLTDEEFLPEANHILRRFRAAQERIHPGVLNDERVGAIHALESVCEDVEPMTQRVESRLHPWVSYGILPLFALVNAGVELSLPTLHMLGQPLGVGILLGLCLGKPIGIVLFTRLAVWLRLASLPPGTNWIQVAGAGILAGIGFTMSIFIAHLGLDAALLDGAKLAVLCASLASGIVGFLFLWSVGKTRPDPSP
jgi:NhaA family Na+:H+ antiporter